MMLHRPAPNGPRTADGGPVSVPAGEWSRGSVAASLTCDKRVAVVYVRCTSWAGSATRFVAVTEDAVGSYGRARERIPPNEGGPPSGPSSRGAYFG